MRNKDVETRIAEVISEWKTATRGYTFESRIFGGAQFPPHLSGEAVLLFHIRIDGFFEDNKCQKPIDLVFNSDLFFTSQLNQNNPVNSNGDAVKLKAFLDMFTEDSYQKAKDILNSYEDSYTSDPLYWK